MSPSSQHNIGEVGHPVAAGSRPAAEWLTARAISLATMIAFIASCGLVLAAPRTLVTTVVTLLAVLIVALVVQRLLIRDAWSYVPGAYSRAYATRGDTSTESPGHVIEIYWFLLEMAVWIVGGALIIVSVPGVWSAAFLLYFGVYMLSVTIAMRASSNSRGHWLLEIRTAIFGAAWVGQGITSEPSLLRLWPSLIGVALLAATFVVVMRAIKA